MDREAIRAEIVRLAQRIPCEMCEVKGGRHIEPDGGCRHRPDTRNRYEIISRVVRAITNGEAGWYVRPPMLGGVGSHG